MDDGLSDGPHPVNRKAIASKQVGTRLPPLPLAGEGWGGGRQYVSPLPLGYLRAGYPRSGWQVREPGTHEEQGALFEYQADNRAISVECGNSACRAFQDGNRLRQAVLYLAKTRLLPTRRTPADPATPH